MNFEKYSMEISRKIKEKLKKIGMQFRENLKEI